jgi:hypothetical protein
VCVLRVTNESVTLVETLQRFRSRNTEMA